MCRYFGSAWSPLEGLEFERNRLLTEVEGMRISISSENPDWSWDAVRPLVEVLTPDSDSDARVVRGIYEFAKQKSGHAKYHYQNIHRFPLHNPNLFKKMVFI